MTKNKINALESLRGFASVYVAIGHWLLWSHIHPALKAVFKFGTEAVTIFFLLSGFVIFYSAMKSDNFGKGYFIRRFRRIYFPFLCTLVVSCIVLYKDKISISELIGNILMLQDQRRTPGNIVNPFLGNQPLWSLSYEWTFYLIFPFIYPLIKNLKGRVHVISMFSIVNLLIFMIVPNHIFLVFTYFFIWWSGLELCEYFFGSKIIHHCNLLIRYYLLFIVILFVNWAYFYYTNRVVDLAAFPFLPLRQFIFSFVCVILAIYFTEITSNAVKQLRIFTTIAPISYSLYILHFPIWIQLHLSITPILEIIFKVILLVGLAYVIEVILQPKINKILK